MIGIVPYQCQRKVLDLLVTGATGNVGAEVVRALIDAGEPCARSPARPGALPAGVEAVAGDLNRPDSLCAALAGVPRRVPLPGYADMDGVLAAVRDAGVEHVVLLSGSSAGSGDTSNAVTAYMLRSEAAVKGSGVASTILGLRLHVHALRWRDHLREGDVVREPFANVGVAVIDPHDIGEVAASALRAEGHEGSTTS